MILDLFNILWLHLIPEHTCDVRRAAFGYPTKHFNADNSCILQIIAILNDLIPVITRRNYNSKA